MTKNINSIIPTAASGILTYTSAKEIIIDAAK